MDGRSFPRRTLVPALLGLAAATAPVWAGNDAWTVAGQPSGGTVLKVVVDPATPGTLYAISEPGVFESTDAGAHWSLVLPMLQDDAFDIAIDPVNPKSVYVAGQMDGLWKTSDGGKNWARAGKFAAAHAVTVDPVDEGVVYVIANGCDINKSTDGGVTWNLIDTGISTLTGNKDARGQAIAVDPANPQILYLATSVGTIPAGGGTEVLDAASGLYTSADGGAHWTQSLADLAFTNVVIDPNDDQNVYADNYVSNDAGATWVQATGSGAIVTVLAVAPANSQVLWGTDVFGNLWTTIDQGADWNQASIPYSTLLYNVAYDPGTPTTLYYASADFGVYKSTDGGSTWASSSTGIYDVAVRDMFMDGAGAIYIGSQGTGVLKSTDKGASWSTINTGITVNAGLNGISVNSLVEDPKAAKTLYAGTVDGLFKTMDGGGNWSVLSKGLTDGYVTSLALDPENPETVFAGAVNGEVFKSADGGSSWGTVMNSPGGGTIEALAVDPSNGKRVFAGAETDGLLQSVDGGATWAKAGPSLPGAGVWCLGIDPKTPTTMYACVLGQDIYKSTDGGQSWSSSSDGLPAYYTFISLKINPENTSELYATEIAGTAVYVSRDAGAHWASLGTPFGADAQVMRTSAVRTAVSAGQPLTVSAVAVDPNSVDVYGAASDKQVYVYSNSNPPASSGGGSSSGGGGAFSLFAGLLLGFGLLRRRRRA